MTQTLKNDMHCYKQAEGINNYETNQTLNNKFLRL